MRDVAAPLRRRSRLAFWATAGVVLLICHDAVFLAQLGPGRGVVQALRSAGHEYWSAASLLLLLAGLVAAGATIRRILALRRRAHALHATPAPTAILPRALRSGTALFAVVAIGFVLQENAEHFIAHGHLIGLGAVVGPEYPLALPVIGAMTAGGGLVVALFGGAVERLAVAIAAALATLRPRPQRRLAPVAVVFVLPSAPILARSGASRAPPSMLPAT
jgi:hypothetical protein